MFLYIEISFPAPPLLDLPEACCKTRFFVVHARCKLVERLQTLYRHTPMVFISWMILRRQEQIYGFAVFAVLSVCAWWVYPTKSEVGWAVFYGTNTRITKKDLAKHLSVSPVSGCLSFTAWLSDPLICVHAPMGGHQFFFLSLCLSLSLNSYSVQRCVYMSVSTVIE